jgi:hypothetical protein
MSLQPAALRRRRGGLIAAGTLLALTGLAACGEEDDDPSEASGSTTTSPSATPTLTPTPSATASTSSAEPPVEESGKPAPRPAGESIDAAEFLEVFEAAVRQASSANVTMNQSASGLEGEGAVDYESDPLSMQMTATMAGMGDIEMRLVDNIMYMKLPMLGDKFVAFDLDDPTNPLGGSFADFFDLDTMLAAFADGIESATYVGEEDVDGEGMEHYTVVSDPSAMLEGLEMPEGAPPVDLPETQTIDVWFDSDGFFRRVVTDLGSLGTTTMTYDDWGTDVSVEAPPASQVTSAPGAATA